MPRGLGRGVLPNTRFHMQRGQQPHTLFLHCLNGRCAQLYKEPKLWHLPFGHLVRMVFTRAAVGADGPPTDRRRTCRHLGDVLKNHGMFYLEGFCRGVRERFEASRAVRDTLRWAMSTTSEPGGGEPARRLASGHGAHLATGDL